MRQIREILRYHCDIGLSLERIARALGLSKGAVHNTLQRFRASGLLWPLPEGLSDSNLEARLYPKQEAPADCDHPALPDVEYVEKELRRKHVTLELLYREYRDQHPDGMSRATYYRHVRSRLPKSVDMKMVHKGGDKLFVDFSGDGPHYIDRATGEIKEAGFFIASWGASSYTYAEATPTEGDEDFAMAHAHGFSFFGCVSHASVPDNTKSAIDKPNRYEPKANAVYQKLAEHYNLAILPARVRAPKDKAVVESNVGFAQRYILGRLRDRRFFSINEINVAVRELLVALNNEPMPAYGGQSRKERFLTLDKPYAQQLPAEAFRIRAMKLEATVAPNYHVRFQDHFYSVPYHLARQKVDIYLDGNIVEIYHDHLSVARHRKQPPNFGYTTIPEHMPPNHRFVRGWSKEWFIKKATEVGPCTAQAVEMVMARRRHVQQGFNSAMGVLNLARKYSPQRLEAAAARALYYRGVSYRSLCAILEQNLDKQALVSKKPEATRSQDSVSAIACHHENVRGADYYSQTSLFTNEGENPCI